MKQMFEILIPLVLIIVLLMCMMNNNTEEAFSVGGLCRNPEEEEKAIKTLKEAMMCLSNECERRYGFKYTMPIGIELKLGDDWLNMKEVYKSNG